MHRPAFSRHALYIYIRLSIYLHISIRRYTYCIFSKRNWYKVGPPTLTCMAVSMRRPAFSRYVLYISIRLSIYLHIYIYVDIYIVSLANVVGIKLRLLRSPVRRFLCADRRSHDTYSIYLSVYRYIYMYIYVDIHSVPLANVIGIKLHLLRSPAWRFLCANRRSHDT